MKNFIEASALFLVGLLSLAIVFFIVQYNLIEDEDVVESLVFEKFNTENTQVKTKSYLDALEGYGDDKDIAVNSKEENDKNTVSVQSELSDDLLDSTIEDKSKNSYMENLENYSGINSKKEDIVKEEKVKKEPMNRISFNASGEPKKLAKDEIVDEVGLAIDALDL